MLSRRTLIKLAGLGPIMTSGITLAGWQTKPDMPYPVQEIYPALHNNKIVVAGGIYAKPDKSLGITRSVVAYDLETQTWGDFPQLPEPAHHPMLASVNNKLYAFSGFLVTGAGRWTASNKVWLLDEAEDKWLELTESVMPNAMCETVVMVNGNNVHLATGRSPHTRANGQWRDQLDHDKHLIFDTNTGKWQQGPATLTARNSAAAAVVGGLWYVVGGRTVVTGNVADNEVYDPGTQKWSSLKPMPQAQGGLAAAAIGKTLFAFGGEFFNDGGGVYSEVWAYDIDKDDWRLADRMPVPRHGLGALTVKDEIYVIGGAAQVGGNETTPRLSVFKP